MISPLPHLKLLASPITSTQGYLYIKIFASAFLSVTIDIWAKSHYRELFFPNRFVRTRNFFSWVGTKNSFSLLGSNMLSMVLTVQYYNSLVLCEAKGINDSFPIYSHHTVCEGIPLLIKPIGNFRFHFFPFCNLIRHMEHNATVLIKVFWQLIHPRFYAEEPEHLYFIRDIL